MKTSIALACAAVMSVLATAAIAQTPAPQAPADAAPAAANPAKGEELFNTRCKMCHGGGGAPDRAALATHKPADIVEILTTGAMAGMASGMSAEDKANIAAFITAPAPAAAPAA